MESPQNLAASFASLIVVAWVTAIVMTEVLPRCHEAKTGAGEGTVSPGGC